MGAAHTDETGDEIALPSSLSTPQQIRAVMSTPVVTGRHEESCRDIAQRMRAHGVSSVVIVGGQALGIVTDRDLRDRLVAADVPSGSPVSAIATTPVHTVTPETPVHDVLALMLSHGIHHVPVVDGSTPVGMVTAGDLLRARTMSPTQLGERIDAAADLPGIQQALASRTRVVGGLLDAGMGGTAVGRVVAALTDRVVRRLIALATEQVGPPPTDYGWLAFGSHGRREQTLLTDQDTGLLLPDDLTEAEHAWFADLGTMVTDGLAACGYERCGGGVMASEPGYRRTASAWRGRIAQMVSAPTVQALLGAEIELDVRTVAGGMDAAVEVGPSIRQIAGQEIFLARLAREATHHRPPLRSFGRIAVARTGEHKGTVDLKAGAMLPIADLARLATLGRGGAELGTDDRLAAAVADGRMSAELGATLRAGYDLALRLRLAAQVSSLERGLPVSNRIAPGDLPSFVRLQLRETLKGIATAQELLARTYLTHLLS